MSDRPPGNAGGQTDRLAELSRRIEAARTPETPKRRGDKDKYAAMSLGWRIVIELVVSIMTGAAMGWGLDSLLGSLPLFLIVFTLFGFAAGIRTIMRSAEEMQRKQAAKAADQDERA